MDKHVFPKEMLAIKNWISWRYEPDPGGGKDKKVPYSPTTGKKALVNNPATWASFDEAMQAKEKYYNGIGFVFTEEAGIVAIDIASA
jgi:primase-polymerase (primpol)-like protein